MLVGAKADAQQQPDTLPSIMQFFAGIDFEALLQLRLEAPLRRMPSRSPGCDDTRDSHCQEDQSVWLDPLDTYDHWARQPSACGTSAAAVTGFESAVQMCAAGGAVSAELARKDERSCAAQQDAACSTDSRIPTDEFSDW